MAAEWLKLWVDLGQWLFMLCLTVWMYLGNRAAVRRATYETHIANLEERMKEKGTRITRLEEAVLRAPTHNDIARVTERLEAVHAELSHLSGSVGGLKAGMDIIHAHLLDRPN